MEKVKPRKMKISVKLENVIFNFKFYVLTNCLDETQKCPHYSLRFNVRLGQCSSLHMEMGKSELTDLKVESRRPILKDWP